MTQWEYAVIVCRDQQDIEWLGAGQMAFDDGGLIGAMNRAGAEGWELVSGETPAHGSRYWGYGNIVYTFKRAIA